MLLFVSGKQGLLQGVLFLDVVYPGHMCSAVPLPRRPGVGTNPAAIWAALVGVGVDATVFRRMGRWVLPATGALARVAGKQCVAVGAAVVSHGWIPRSVLAGVTAEPVLPGIARILWH